MTGSGMHDDEVAVDDVVVRRLVAAQLPEWGGLPVRRLPPVGTDNQLFRLGDDLLVRMPRIHWAAESASWEHAWLPRLAPHLELPVPAPVALGEPGEGYPWQWTVVPWLEGATPTWATMHAEQWAAALGGFVRTLRSVPAMGGPVKKEGRGAPLVALDEWVRTWTGRADSAVDRSAVLAVWEDALAAPAWEADPAWFHGDLHEGNLLVRGGRLAAVIDWGAAGRGDPAVELNVAWNSLPESVVTVYRDAVGLDEAAWRRSRGFALAPAISSYTYYRDTAPELSAGGLATVRRLVASMG